jgi:hypothetical protein
VPSCYSLPTTWTWRQLEQQASWEQQAPPGLAHAWCSKALTASRRHAYGTVLTTLWHDLADRLHWPFAITVCTSVSTCEDAVLLIVLPLSYSGATAHPQCWQLIQELQEAFPTRKARQRNAYRMPHPPHGSHSPEVLRPPGLGRTTCPALHAIHRQDTPNWCQAETQKVPNRLHKETEAWHAQSESLRQCMHVANANNKLCRQTACCTN